MPIIERKVSRPFHVADIPIPQGLKLQFIYNFFESNEKITRGLAFSDLRNGEPYPRAFKITWSTLGLSNFVGSNVDIRTNEEDSLSTQQQELLNSIVSAPIEEVNDASVLTQGSTTAFVQDYNFDSRIARRMSESAMLRGHTTGSTADTAQILKSILGESFNQDWLNTPGTSTVSYNDLERRTVSLDSDSNDEMLQLLIDNERARAAFKEFQGSTAARASYDAFNSLRSFYAKTSDSPTEEDVNPTVSGVSDKESNSRSTRPVLLGYMVEKFASDAPDPTTPEKFVVPRGTSSYLDTAVRYGQTYSYRVRTIAAIYAETEISDSAEVGLCLLPFLSDPSRSVTLTAEESVPPPAPADFNLHWNYQDSTLQIIWSFPNNPQRDIKYWQVFRRSSINEPYSLIRMIDFDDSVERTPFPETIDNSLISKFQGPVNYYVDPEFNKDSDYIYTMCSVDAHGQSSNYGIQFRVRFDKYRNKLIKELISPSGASKQYPNTYLNAELTLDSVKSSGSTKMRVYFDPEYLAVTNSDKRDQGFLRISNSAIYQIQLINIDRQKQSSISISISDPTNYVAGVVESATTT